MKKIIIVSFLLLICTSVSAQFGMKKKIEQLKNIKERTLLIVLEDLNQLNKKSQDYDFENIFNDIWTLNKEFRIISKSELKIIRKNKSDRDKFAYLLYSDTSSYNNFPGNSISIGLLEKNICTYYQYINYNENIYQGDLYFTIQRLHQDLIDLINYKRPSKKDMLALHKKQKEDASILKERKLLIDEDIVDKKLNSFLLSNYKYEFQIVKKEIINNAILNKDENIIYIRKLDQVSPPVSRTARSSFDLEHKSNLISVKYSIYNANNGKVIYFFNLPTSRSFSRRPSLFLKIKHFEELIESL